MFPIHYSYLHFLEKLIYLLLCIVWWCHKFTWWITLKLKGVAYKMNCKALNDFTRQPMRECFRDYLGRHMPGAYPVIYIHESCIQLIVCIFFQKLNVPISCWNLHCFLRFCCIDLAKAFCKNQQAGFCCSTDSGKFFESVCKSIVLI